MIQYFKNNKLHTLRRLYKLRYATLQSHRDSICMMIANIKACTWASLSFQRSTNVLTIEGQPVVLRGRQGRKVTSLVFEHHRGRDDLATHSYLQHHQSCVVGWKHTNKKSVSIVQGGRCPVKG